MQYSFVSAAILAFSAVVSAQYVNPTADFDAIYTPAKDQTVAAGSTLDITWDFKAKYAGSVTIQLLQGASTSTLVPGQTVATVDNAAQKYSWTIPEDLGADATYGFTITLDSSTAVASEKIYQYSFPFHITGAKDTTSSSLSSASSPSTTTVSLSTGSAYIASSTTAAESAASVVPTSAPLNATNSAGLYYNVTTATSTYCPSEATSNGTLATTFASATKTANGTTAPSTIAVTGAANGLAVSAGLAMIGSVLAFAL